jgi:hypothetical protein
LVKRAKSRSFPFGCAQGQDDKFMGGRTWNPTLQKARSGAPRYFG